MGTRNEPTRHVMMPSLAHPRSSVTAFRSPWQASVGVRRAVVIRSDGTTSCCPVRTCSDVGTVRRSAARPSVGADPGRTGTVVTARCACSQPRPRNTRGVIGQPRVGGRRARVPCRRAGRAHHVVSVWFRTRDTTSRAPGKLRAVDVFPRSAARPQRGACRPRFGRGGGRAPRGRPSRGTPAPSALIVWAYAALAFLSLHVFAPRRGRLEAAWMPEAGWVLQRLALPLLVLVPLGVPLSRSSRCHWRSRSSGSSS